MMRSRWVVTAAVLLGSVLCAGCKQGEASADQKPAEGRSARGGSQAVFAVETASVEKRKVEYLVQEPGKLDAFEHVQVTARVAGVVDKVAFREGQEVKKGDVLVVIDAARYRLSVNTAKAQLDKSKAAEADNTAMVERRQGASEKFPGLIPGEELATYETRLLTAKADTAVSTENLRTAELNLRDANVRAPMAGVIQTRSVQTGQYVSAGTVMATLLQSEPMLLRFMVSPQDAPRIKPGMGVEFTLRESTGVYTAKVSLVAASADEVSHMVAVTAVVEPTTRKYWLRPGAFADVTVRVGASRDAPLIPRAAVRPSERGLLVYVVDDAPAEEGSTRSAGKREGAASGEGKREGAASGEGKREGAGAKFGVAREVPVTLGMTTKDGWVEVRTGLSGGERLVVRGGESMSSGVRVRETVVSLPAPGSQPAPAASGPAEGMPSAQPEPAGQSLPEQTP